MSLVFRIFLIEFRAVKKKLLEINSIFCISNLWLVVNFRYCVKGFDFLERSQVANNILFLLSVRPFHLTQHCNYCNSGQEWLTIGAPVPSGMWLTTALYNPWLFIIRTLFWVTRYRNDLLSHLVTTL